jgi:hypothetical protein
VGPFIQGTAFCTVGGNPQDFVVGGYYVYETGAYWDTSSPDFDVLPNHLTPVVFKAKHVLHGFPSSR